jgi:hypothetical protein
MMKQLLAILITMALCAPVMAQEYKYQVDPVDIEEAKAKMIAAPSIVLPAVLPLKDGLVKRYRDDNKKKLWGTETWCAGVPCGTWVKYKKNGKTKEFTFAIDPVTYQITWWWAEDNSTRLIPSAEYIGRVVTLGYVPTPYIPGTNIEPPWLEQLESVFERQVKFDIYNSVWDKFPVDNQMVMYMRDLDTARWDCGGGRFSKDGSLLCFAWYFMGVYVFEGSYTIPIKRLETDGPIGKLPDAMMLLDGRITTDQVDCEVCPSYYERPTD